MGHALVVAGNFADARELLQRLAKENMLVSRDQLDLGIVLLVESQKKNKQALAYIEAARKTIGDHPRVLAAMALALQKTERIDEASYDVGVHAVDDRLRRARRGVQAVGSGRRPGHVGERDHIRSRLCGLRLGVTQTLVG